MQSHEQLGRHQAGLIEFDPEQLAHAFDREPFALRHQLAQHPLLQLPRIIELARTLPSQSVEYNAGDIPLNQDPSLTPRNGLSIEQTLERIEDCRSWMVLKDVQNDPHYRQLLDQCLDQIQPSTEHVAPGMCQRKAFIFVSSPEAITPYHVDFEYNILLQVRGEKIITVFDPVDRAVFSEIAREQFVCGAHRNLEYEDAFAAHGRAFHLRPGLGVHVPLTSPHWVQVGDQTSVSLSITFQSARSHRLELAHLANAQLRRFGIQPRQAGDSSFRDGVKVFGYRAVRKLRHVVGRNDVDARHGRVD
jgi:hypothetical protein